MREDAPPFHYEDEDQSEVELRPGVRVRQLDGSGDTIGESYVSTFTGAGPYTVTLNDAVSS